ncbi:MAG: lysylphosphatidylglycerol synthase transmembrane domain-containing protein [Bacteroidota bacterium]
MNRPASKKAFLLIKVVLAGAALAFLIGMVDGQAVLAALWSASPLWIGLALVLLPVNLLLEAWKWHTLLDRTLPETPRFRETFGSMMSGYALGLFTPARVGDYAGRAFYLRHHDRLEIAALTFADRMIALAAYLTAGWLCLLYFLLFHLRLPGAVWQMVAVLGLLGIGAALYIVVHPRMAYVVLMRIIPGERLRRRLTFLSRLRPHDTDLLLAQSAVRYIVFSAQFVCLVYAFGGDLGLVDAFAGVGLVFFAQTVLPSVTLADLGIREGAAVYFLGAFGVAHAAAFDAAFMLFTINLLLPALVGTPFLLKLRIARDQASTATQPSGLAGTERLSGGEA